MRIYAYLHGHLLRLGLVDDDDVIVIIRLKVCVFFRFQSRVSHRLCLRLADRLLPLHTIIDELLEHTWMNQLSIRLQYALQYL